MNIFPNGQAAVPEVLYLGLLAELPKGVWVDEPGVSDVLLRRRFRDENFLALDPGLDQLRNGNVRVLRPGIGKEGLEVVKLIVLLIEVYHIIVVDQVSDFLVHFCVSAPKVDIAGGGEKLGVRRVNDQVIVEREQLPHGLGALYQPVLRHSLDHGVLIEVIQIHAVKAILNHKVGQVQAIVNRIIPLGGRELVAAKGRDQQLNAVAHKVALQSLLYGRFFRAEPRARAKVGDRVIKHLRGSVRGQVLVPAQYHNIIPGVIVFWVAERCGQVIV